MDFIVLSPQDLALAAVLVVALAATTVLMRLAIGAQLIIAAARTTLQLSLIGFVLKALFAHASGLWIALMAIVMLLIAGWEVRSRQTRRFHGVWGFGMGTVSMFVSTFAVTLFALLAVIGTQPWYTPQYAIPLLGMMLGNTMNGVALSLDRLTHDVWQQRAVIEGRLLLGEDWSAAITDIRRQAMRTGMIPIINAMAAAGLVSLPGMMTGQILAGSPPLEAVKYQILIMFLIAAGTGFGTMTAVLLGARRLFDERQRLRTDRLAGPPDTE